MIANECLCLLASEELSQENREREGRGLGVILLVLSVWLSQARLKTRGHCCSRGHLFCELFLFSGSGNFSPMSWGHGNFAAASLGSLYCPLWLPEACPHFAIRFFVGFSFYQTLFFQTFYFGLGV